MSIQRKSVTFEDYIAQIDLFLTNDGSDGKGCEIVGEGDYRARFLLARKGSSIPAKLAKRLGIDENFKLQPVQTEPPKTAAPEEIKGRSTRPEKPAAER